MNSPLISCVIPAYNREFFLRRTIDSVLNQDYPHVECIVIDGGSTDGSVEILKSYGDRIRWVSEPDEGHSDAINKGWKMAKGEVLAWLNADDVWAVPNAASIVARYMSEHPEIDLLYGDCGLIDIDGNVVSVLPARDWNLEYAVTHCDHVVYQPAAFIRREILEKVGWLDTSFYQKKDHELWLRIALAGTIRHIPEVLAYASNHEGLTFDGWTAAPACVQITRTFFKLEGVPPSLRPKQRRAVSNSYLRGAAYAWAGGRLWSLALRYVVAAVVADPTNVGELAGYAFRGARWYLRKGRASLSGHARRDATAPRR